ncbi:hypothetical protein [Bradyrhizobium sp. LA7.1]|uniref:hypothetical protein n=1 Tax=Bradyrhizobium sp. LA7.1 TaxID=3156324 RepID=UPI00339849E4
MPLIDLEEHPFSQLGPPIDFSPDGLRLWISEACKFLNISPTELARAANLAPSTVNKFLLSAGSKKSLSARTMDGIVKSAMRIYIDKFGENRRKLLEQKQPGGSQTPTILVSGTLELGAFKERLNWPVQDQFHIQVPIPNQIYGPPLVGLVVADEQGGDIFPVGTVIVAGKFDAALHDIRAGDWFVVARKDDHGAIETTLRQVLVSPGGDVWLISMSKSPDEYLGKIGARDEIKPNRAASRYIIEYKVLSAIVPVASEFSRVKFSL